MISTSYSVLSREEDGGPHSLFRMGQLFLLFDSFISSSFSSSPSSSSSSVTINCAISSATSTSSSSRQTTTSSFLQFIISLFLFFLYSPVLNIAEDAKSCKMLPKQNSSSRSEHLHRSSSSSLQHDQKGHQQRRSSDQRSRKSFFRAAALLCTLFLAMSSPSLSSASPPISFQSSSSVVSSIPPPPSSYHHHQSSPLNLHRHHHPSHPHSYQNRAQQQQQQVNYPQEYNSGSFKSYNFHPHQFMQSEQPFGLQYNSQSAPKQSDRPVVADRTVRRISSAAESSNYFHNFPQHGLSIHNSGDPHSSSKQHYQPNSRIHTTTVSRQSSSTSKSTSPQPQPSTHFDPTKVCPEGPPSQWAKQLDVAGKAYLAPIVFTGQLVSLSEDFGGRIAATFRLLRLLKPTEVHGGGGNGQGSINHHSHHHHQQHHNSPNSSSAVAALSALTNADYERHVKLFFFNRSTSAAGAASSSSLEPPYCAPFMADIKERLVTKQNYLLFAHEHVIATYRVRATSAPPSPSQTVTTTRHHQQQHHISGNSHRQSSSRSHTPIELISLVTYADPEPLNRNTSRLVRKVLCKGCAKAAVVHSSASTFMVPVRGNISLACRMDGTPLPWIEWYRNGKRLRAREGKRVIIKRKRRVSHLTIIRASFRRDKGVYECRAMNVVSKEPAVKRFQVIVLRSESASTSGANRGFGADSKNNGRRKFRPMDGSGRVAGGQTAVSGGPPSSSSSHHYSSEGQQPYQQPSTPTSRRPVEPPDYYDSHETGQNPFSRKPIGFFHGQPCPIPDYCLNGGTCSLYETLGEYVCQCADGYRGQRCEFKDINKYPAHKALLDYDLSTRMLHSVMSQKVSVNNKTKPDLIKEILEKTWKGSSLTFEQYLQAFETFNLDLGITACWLPTVPFYEQIFLKLNCRNEPTSAVQQLVDQTIYHTRCEACSELKFALSSSLVQLSDVGNVLKIFHLKAVAPADMNQISFAEEFQEKNIHSIANEFLIRIEKIGALGEQHSADSDEEDTAKNFFFPNRQKMMRYLHLILEYVKPLIEQDAKVLELNAPCFVFGDLNGSLKDLLRFSATVFRTFPFIDSTNLLFLGNYTDAESTANLECLIYLICMKILSPGRVFLLRGSNELAGRQQIQMQDSDRSDEPLNDIVCNLLGQIFDSFPIAAVIEDSIFASHSGIPREFSLSHMKLVCEYGSSASSSTAASREGRLEASNSLSSVASTEYEHLMSELLLQVVVGEPCFEGEAAPQQQPIGKGSSESVFNNRDFELFISSSRLFCAVRSHQEFAEEGFQANSTFNLLTLVSSTKGAKVPACLFIDYKRIRLIRFE